MKIFDINSEECIRFVNEYYSIEKFLISFKKEYTHILSYHSTKLSINELAKIKEEGLILASKELYRNKALSRFILENDEEIIKQKITNSVDHFLKVKPPYTIGEINFVMTTENISKAYQYLKFGTEQILGLASNLKRELNINFRTRMIKYGKPYIIKTILPVSDIENQWIENIYNYLNEGFFEASLVYHKNVPSKLILEIKEEREPIDYQNFEYC